MQFVQNDYVLGYAGNSHANQAGGSNVMTNGQVHTYASPHSGLAFQAHMMPSVSASSPSVQTSSSESSLGSKPKRKQVKNACVNCQKACKKCDDGRPCQRCIKYGLTDTCTNSVRKERKKGVKRGPYKRKNNGSATDSSSPAGSTSSERMSTGYYGMSGPGGARGTNISMQYPPYSNGSYDPYQGMNYSGASNPMLQMIQQQQQHHQMYQAMPYQPIGMVRPGTAPQFPSTKAMPQGIPKQTQQHQTMTSSIHTSVSKEQEHGNVKAESGPEGSRLNTLSRLCSDVLDTPGSSKESVVSYSDASIKPSFRGTPSGDSTPSYLNAQLPQRNMYTSTVSTPPEPYYKQGETPTQMPQTSMWPLPPIQSAVANDRATMYSTQQQQQQQQPSPHGHPAAAASSADWQNSSLSQW